MTADKIIKALLIEDSPGDVRLLQEMIRAGETDTSIMPTIELEWVDNLAAGLERLERRDIDAVLLDLSLPDSQGFETFIETQEHAPRLPIIVLTGLDDEKLAIDAVRQGAQDYLVKGQVDSNLLTRAIYYAIERKQSEQALEETREYAESIVEAVREPLVVLDTDLRVISANRSFYQTFKTTTAETVEQPFSDLGDGQWDNPRLQKLLRKTIAENRSFDDFRVYHDFPRIGRRVMSLNARKIYQETGKKEMILLAINDITTYQWMEEVLRDSAKDFLTIFNSVYDAIFIHDLDGAVIDVNNKMLEMYGVNRQQAMEMSIQNNYSCPEGDQKELQQHWEKALTGQSQLFEWRAWRPKDSTYFDVEMHFQKVPFRKKQAVLTTVRDITDRKRAEEQIAALYLREQERRKLSDTLRQVALIVSSTLDQQTVLDLILAQLETVVGYDRATVLILNEDILETVAVRDKNEDVAKHVTTEAYKFELNATVLRTKKPVLIPDVTYDERWVATNTTSAIHSIVVAPLLVQDEPIGLLFVGRGGEIAYTPDDAQTIFAFASQVAVALESARLHEYEIAQIDREMGIARQIQQSLLPPEEPQISGLMIAGHSQAARRVGGDFFNYFIFDQKHLGIALGDVSGKGMQAALMMALSFGLLTTEVRRDIAPGVLLTELNTAIMPHTRRNRLNTALGYLTLETGDGMWQLRAANAGVIEPLLRKQNGEMKWLHVGGLPLGMKSGVEYDEINQPLNSGDVLILCSDGIVEAMDESGEMYGFERLTSCLSTAPQRDANAIQEWVLTDVRVFTGAAEVHDDLTLVVVVIE